MVETVKVLPGLDKARNVVSAPQAGPDQIKGLLEQCLRNTGLAVANGPGERLQIADWKSALPAMKGHALIPLLARGVDLDVLAPADDLHSMAVLEQEHAQAVRQHRLSLVILRQIDSSFWEAGIPYVVLKGPHLYEKFYQSFPRPYGDVDIMIRPSDIDRAIELLSGVGYAPAGNRIGRYVARHIHFHLVLEHRGGTLPRLELHWDLVDQVNLYRINVFDVLLRRSELQTGNINLSGLSDEDNLIYLCVHAAKHGLLNPIGLPEKRAAEWFCHPSADNRMIWFMDIMFLIENEGERIDWERVAGRIKQQNVGEDVAATLRVLGILFPSSQAEETLRRVGLEDAHDSAWSGPLLSRFLQSRTGYRLFQKSLQMHPDLFFRPARLFLLLKVLFHTRTQMRSYYGDCGVVHLLFRYLAHPFRMLFKVLG